MFPGSNCETVDYWLSIVYTYKVIFLPAGVEVTFHCKLAAALDSYWVVDLFPGSTQQHRSELENRGFFVRKILQDGIATLLLRVRAAVEQNETEVFCSSIESFRTDTAVLLVIQSKF